MEVSRGCGGVWGQGVVVLDVCVCVKMVGGKANAGDVGFAWVGAVALGKHETTLCCSSFEGFAPNIIVSCFDHE